MKLTWTGPAADDLEDLVNFIGRDNPDAAARVAKRIVDRLDVLMPFARTGRKGRAEGTYEVLLTPYPYIAIYRITEHEMRIIRIRHGAQS